MKYQVIGTPLPVLHVELENEESVVCESGAMSWMSPNVEMDTTSGGLGKFISRAFSGEKVFQNIYTARNGAGSIDFSSCFPGDILPLEVTPNRGYICQKSAFLASERGVELDAVIHKKFTTGLFGGEGFILEKLTGEGTAFVEIDGSTVCKVLDVGETIVVSSGHVAVMEDSCKIDVVAVKGIKNVFLGGQGIFNTTITGPGKVWLQTMPISKLAAAIVPYVPVQTTTVNTSDK